VLAAPKSSRRLVSLARRDEIDAAKETSEENYGDGDGDGEEAGEFGEEVSARWGKGTQRRITLND